MARLLFWNAYKTANEDAIARVVKSKQADLFALAEARHVSESILIERLQVYCHRTFHKVDLSTRISVYTALPGDYIRPLANLGRMMSLELRQVLSPAILIVFVHLSSKMGQSATSTGTLAIRFQPEIEKLESRVGHRRTIVMGDFNMNPYDMGVISSEAFHATMCSQTAQDRERVVHGQSKLFFYNPMWNLLGDRTHGPPGTFYRGRNDPDDSLWHMLDQVLLRPDIIDLVELDSLSIITRAEDLSLTNSKGRPDRHHSDHFPIYIATRELQEGRP